MENNDKIYYKQLVQRYAENNASEDELEIFFHLLHQGELDEWVQKSMNEDAGIEQKPAYIIRFAKYVKNNWVKISAAAIILIVATSSYVFFTRPSSRWQALLPQQQSKIDLPPGTSRAILTLANGNKVVLDSASTGQLNIHANTVVIKSGSSLVYSDSTINGGLTEYQTYNILSTGRGETYSLVLADGSKVWLNSASSIRFPVIFIGKERRVEVQGEVYFEVAKDPRKPFIVAVNNSEVNALGTSFNINSYADESATVTTLIEGSIRVSKMGNQIVIKPGQQTLVNDLENVIQVKEVDDVSSVIAWKRGMFEFNKMDLHAIMRQICRWYDVDIVFESSLTDEKFGGAISRYLTLSNVLKLIEANGVKFKLIDKKLYVQQ